MIKDYLSSFISEISAQLNTQLQFIQLETDEPIKSAELSINVLLSVIGRLKKFIVKYKFKNDQEEIDFFKNIKPLFLSKLIYYNRIFNIESKKPSGGEKVLRKYLANELDRIKRYFDNNLDFYRYYRTQSTYLDYKYFLRGKYDIRLCIDSFFFEADIRFSTSHDFKVAKILANDRIEIYIQEQLLHLDRSETAIPHYSIMNPKIQWTESKTALIELVYALQAAGVIDHGRSDIKNIASAFEQLFGVDLGDYYRTFMEIRIRKMGRTKFIDALREALIRKMDETDTK